MNDSPTSAPNGPPPGDEAPQDAPSAPAFRMPDGAPAGTSARGTLTATEDEAPKEPSNSNAESGSNSGGTPTDSRDFADEWASLESADGRPIESPYQDETALQRALLSDDVRNSPGFDYPLEPSAGHDFSHVHSSYDSSYDAPPGTTDPADDPYHPSYRSSYMEPPADMAELALDVPREDFTDAQLATATSGGSEPPTVPGSTILDEVDDNAPRNDREMGLMEHLGELRTRIMWCVAVIGVAMMVTWNFAQQLEALIIAPVKSALKQAGKPGSVIVVSPTEGFMLQFNISLIAALVVTAPFLLYQIWKFIEPAMTKRERRFTGILVPFSSLLFFMGCALAYVMSPLFFAFFAMFVPPDTLANWSFAESAVLLAKMLLICGICFQVPVFTIFLNKSGIVSRNVLIEYWRHVVVVIFIVVAILTPTWDPVSLMVCALPPCFLYALSIWLVKWL